MPWRDREFMTDGSNALPVKEKLEQLPKALEEFTRLTLLIMIEWRICTISKSHMSIWNRLSNLMGRLAGEISRWIVVSNDTDCNNPPPKLTSVKKNRWHCPPPSSIGSFRYRRFRGEGDVTNQVDWVRGCRFRTIIKVVKILMTASLCDFVELFVALYKLIFFFVVTWLRLKSSAFSSSFTTTLFLLAMTISWFCTKFFCQKTQIFHMTSIVALTWITWVKLNAKQNSGLTRRTFQFLLKLCLRRYSTYESSYTTEEASI